MSTPQKADSLARRDSFTLALLGAFFGVFGILVLLGLLWKQTSEERWVTTIASVLLVLAGIACGYLAKRNRR